jgi:predicted transglutaminase-like cysteine proteinase
MTRSIVGITVAALVMAFGSLATAQPTSSPRVTTSRGDGHVTLVAKTDEVRVSQTMTSNGFDLTVSDGRDAARITGDVHGRVHVERGGRRVSLTLQTSTPADARAASTLLMGSTALARFGEIIATGWARSTKEALVFVSAHAMVALLQGNAAPLRAMANRIATSAEPQLVRVRQRTAGECWRSYEQDVLGYTYELEQCLAEASYSLNPLRSAWCAYSYNLKTSLAFIWLLDCSGF